MSNQHGVVIFDQLMKAMGYKPIKNPVDHRGGILVVEVIDARDLVSVQRKDARSNEKERG